MKRALITLAVGTFVLTLVAITSVACGTSPVGVEACKKIEKVRCESAQACGLDLKRPVHERDDEPVSNVAACIRYYDDQCLHGIVAPDEPNPQDVDACVNAIITGDCAIVKTPEISPSCKFLIPPARAAAAADAATEAAAEASAPAASVDASTD